MNHRGAHVARAAAASTSPEEFRCRQRRGMDSVGRDGQSRQRGTEGSNTRASVPGEPQDRVYCAQADRRARSVVFMAQPPVLGGGGNNERGRNLRASVRNVKRSREVGVAWRPHDEAWVHRYTPFLDQPVRFKMERPTELRHRCHKPPRQAAPPLLKPGVAACRTGHDRRVQTVHWLSMSWRWARPAGERHDSAAVGVIAKVHGLRPGGLARRTARQIRPRQLDAGPDVVAPRSGLGLASVGTRELTGIASNSACNAGTSSGRNSGTTHRGVSKKRTFSGGGGTALAPSRCGTGGCTPSARRCRAGRSRTAVFHDPG